MSGSSYIERFVAPVRNLLRRQGRVLFAGVATMLVLGGGAAAITSSQFRYDKERKGYVSIAPGAFAPTVPTTATYTNSAYHLSVSSGLLCFAAGINLPHNAKIGRATATFASDIGNNPILSIYKGEVSVGTNNVGIAHLRLIDDSRSIIEIAQEIPQEQVSNKIFAYSAYLCMGNRDEFFGARLEYSYVTAGD